MESANDYERQRRKRKSYSRVVESDEEGSADKSNKIPNSPIVKAAENMTGYIEESESESEHKSEYEPSFDYAPKAGSPSSIGKPPIAGDRDVEGEAQSEYEASDYGFARPNRTALKSESDCRAVKGSPNPWVAECAHGTAFLKYPVYTALQPLKSHSIEKPVFNWSYQDQHSQPLIRAAWAGAFTVYCNGERISATFDGIKGCVSSKACTVVRLVTEQLPASISWEKLPRWRVWPKSFQQWGPSGDDIAVFFFPSVTKHERAYESLLFDLIHDDLALRTTVMGSELLLFTSVELPPLFTRYQGKFYLWGVYRGNQPQLN